jgi:DNA-binding transcriptional ArsR family regulator
VREAIGIMRRARVKDDTGEQWVPAALDQTLDKGIGQRTQGPTSSGRGRGIRNRHVTVTYALPMADPARTDPFEALGDSNRREILALLRNGERSVSELTQALPISRPAVSRHLRLLKQAGLVAERPNGTRRLYRLQDDGVEIVQEYLQQVWGEAAARFTLLAENTQRR